MFSLHSTLGHLRNPLFVHLKVGESELVEAAEGQRIQGGGGGGRASVPVSVSLAKPKVAATPVIPVVAVASEPPVVAAAPATLEETLMAVAVVAPGTLKVMIALEASGVRSCWSGNSPFFKKHSLPTIVRRQLQ